MIDVNSEIKNEEEGNKDKTRRKTFFIGNVFGIDLNQLAEENEDKEEDKEEDKDEVFELKKNESKSVKILFFNF